jgi:hypothetical protein
MRRYLLFCADYWESRAGLHRVSFGWANFKGDFDTVREAEIAGMIDHRAEQFHIVDSQFKKIVKTHAQDPDKVQ